MRAPLAIAAALTACADSGTTSVPGGDTASADTTSPLPTSPSTPGTTPVPSAPLALCVNEFVPMNDDSWLDETGASPDWIELHNPTADAVSLDGWYVTDDATDPFQTPLDPTLLVPPGGWLVLAADALPELGPAHLPFALAGTGGALGLFRADGQGELLTYGVAQEDFAWARASDCCADLAGCMDQVWLGTPGAANGGAP